MCGEHYYSRADRKMNVGIIPACAGSTIPPSAGRESGRDHPRMCGEHALTVTATDSRGGSSPHVRGARPEGVKLGGLPGIIPACAGSTYFELVSVRPLRDHPRMCGEHSLVYP